MKAKFRKLYTKMTKIQAAVRSARAVRLNRLRLLDRFFEHEKNILIDYHSGKSKKAKKQKSTLASL